MMMNEEKTNLLKLVYDRENDLFFWQYEANRQLGVSDEKLFEMLNELSMYTFIVIGYDAASVKHLSDVCLTLRGLAYLYDHALISDFDYRLRSARILHGQHEV